MKSLALLLIGSVSSIMLEADVKMDGILWDGPYTVTSADDEGFVVPK